MRPRHLLSTLLAAVLAGCGASGIASDSGSNAAGGPATQANSPAANNGAQDFLARSGFLGFSSVSDRAIGQNRYLVFTTRHKLLPADLNGKEDVYLRDLRTGDLSLISVSSSEVQGNGASNQGSISADGRYVAFRSAATNLVASDTNGVDDIFVRDTFLGTTIRASVNLSGVQGNGASQSPAISNKNGANGPFVVFSSAASNLVGTDGNGANDVFSYDLATGNPRVLSTNSSFSNTANAGSFDPAITPDGTLVSYSTDATDIITGGLNGNRQIVRVQRAINSGRILVSQSAGGAQANGNCYEPSISSDGSKIAFFTLASNLGPTDGNGFFDVYLRDIGANTVSRVSLDSGGGESDGHSGFPSLSGDGSVVAFASLATDLVASDTNGVFDVFSRTGGVTTRTSLSTAGTQANIDSDLPAISLDGRHIAFRSAATNLIAKDPLADDDIDIRDRTTPSTFWGTVRCLFPASWPGFGTATAFTTGTVTEGVATGDFNGDGNLDLATANRGSDNVSVLLGNGSGGFGAATNLTTASGPFGLSTADFNGDGYLDLVAVNAAGNNVSVFLNTGSGSFGTATNFSSGAFARYVTTGDFDGDGDIDIATGNFIGNNLSVLLNNGAGSFGTATNFATGSICQAVTTGDFNGDGNLDLATANQGDNNVSVLLGNGAGSFATATTFATGSTAGPAPTSITTGDFDGDGKLDLATSNFNDSNVSVLRGNGAGSFSAAINSATGTAPGSIRACDFDGDGKLDLVTTNRSGNTISVLLGDGAGNFAAPTNFATASTPEFSATGDFDGDGDLDLSVTVSGNVRIYLNQACP